MKQPSAITRHAIRLLPLQFLWQQVHAEQLLTSASGAKVTIGAPITAAVAITVKSFMAWKLCVEAIPPGPLHHLRPSRERPHPRDLFRQPLPHNWVS